MKLLVVVVVAVVGCSKAKHDQPAPPKDAARSVDAAAAVVPAPAHGVPNTAVASAPRKDWPCRMITTMGGPTMLLTKLTYSPAASCWLPVDLAGSRLLVGCPTEKLEQNVASKLDMREQYSYDAAGHLTDVTTIAGVFHYTWDGDLLISRTHPNGHVARYTATASGADLVDQDGDEHVELAGGHVVRYQRGDLESTTFTWQGTRLASVKDLGDTRVDYDCSKPAP